ncbi:MULTISPECIES: YlaH-like family protein [Bacillaceae]|uniref:YlaH-like family protein n=1 Tax=Bacillaceae TaxID=186817 RepID=UPI001BEA3125|nr:MULTISPECIES: YlaH-like family protein [Bacillaceae]MBT2619046.1 YlaH-like family protein [Bacillus sp. ISL-78]MBT2628654.1 YlaH-like family protein [Bacillus sp. ISL-101]MBT2715265.1 YlaH-like family protein [Bacillus sp. ISL-57]USK76393.1 YlaH-like family protein [Peribacillus frigoritolerans]
MDIQERLSFFAALYRVDENPEAGMWYLYLTVFGLCILVYQLGFAKKLPLLKNVVIYVIMALGCTLLSFFAVFLPMGEALVIASLVLGIYRIRLHNSRKEEQA